MSSNPPDWWDAPKPAPREGGRVVRLLGPDDEDDDLPKGMRRLTPSGRGEVRPMLAADVNGDLLTTKEPAMPKGVYERKPRTEKTPAEKPPKQARKARAVALVPEVAAPRVNGSKGRFEVALDLRAGAVTINAASGSLTLAADEVVALFAFLGRRPA